MDTGLDRRDVHGTWWFVMSDRKTSIWTISDNSEQKMAVTANLHIWKLHNTTADGSGR
jgi:hypothetical protein